MITPSELTHRIEHTTLSEAIELFEDKVLRKSLNNYDDWYKRDVQKEYERINYDGAFFFLSNRI